MGYQKGEGAIYKFMALPGIEFCYKMGGWEGECCGEVGHWVQEPHGILMEAGEVTAVVLVVGAGRGGTRKRLTVVRGEVNRVLWVWAFNASLIGSTSDST